MKILGISAFYHDSAAALTIDGEIVAAAQEERFTRKKHDDAFPAQAAAWCLEEAGLELSELDAVVFYDKPFLKFERLLETYYALAPSGIRSFWTAMPMWTKDKLFMKRMLRKELRKLGSWNDREQKLLFPEHHLSHAASAFYPSPFPEAAILTIDGVGEWATASICHGQGNSLKLIREMKFPHSVGLLYSAFTYFLGFRVNSGEYKLMGLAPYGDPASPEVTRFEELIRKELVRIYEDGSIWLNQRHFRYMGSLRMVRDRDWEQIFGVPKRAPEGPLTQAHCNLAMAIQRVTEDIVLKMAAEALRLTGSRNLCLAGGVALNCVANGKLEAAGLADHIWVQPAAGDAGGAIGAALAGEYLMGSTSRQIREGDAMHGSYLGPEFGEAAILRSLRRVKAVYRKAPDEAQLMETVAGHLAEGAAVGWFQGRMEFGPRALGNRSILGDPRNPEMQKKLNLKIKFRESFRPFAPSVLAEKAKEWFDMEAPSPYMLMVHPVAAAQRNALPDGYHGMPLKDKLYVQRSTIPAVTHIDFSARIQTVHQTTNPRYHALISAFEALTGCPMLVNTSFNVRGEPIVCSPEDAWNCFMRNGMDVLVLGDFLLLKEEQSAELLQAPDSTDFPLD